MITLNLFGITGDKMIGLHMKLIGEVPMVYRGAMPIAILASGLIGAGSSAYASKKQEDLAEENQKKLDEAEANRQKEIERIARETRPEAESLKSVKFGTDDGSVGSTKEFIVDKKKNSSGLGTSSSTSGLGFS